MSDYSEAERRLIESRNQAAAATTAPSSVDQLSIPQIDKKPQAKDVDLKGMASTVNEVAKEQQANAPTVFDTIDKDMPWLKWVGGTLGLLGTAYGVSKLFGGDDNTPPDDNNPPNNRSKSPKDRSFTRTEPTLESAGATQASMTAGEPKFVADPTPVAPKPVTDVVTVPGTPDTTASVIPTTDQPKVVPVPSNAPTQIKYGETNYNVPTASPNVAVAPPAAVEPVAVQPKPIDPIQQAKIDKINAETALVNQRAAQEAERHTSRLAADAQRAEASTQKKQGQVKSNIPAKDQAILADNAEAKARAAIVASGQPKPSTASPIGGTSMPVEGAATPPAGTPSPKAVAPTVTAPELEAKLGTPTVTTGSGMPAYQGQGDDKAKMRKEFSTLKDVPSGYVFVPNGQNMDIVRNAVGQDAFTTKLGEFGGYPNTTEAAYQQSRAINKSLGRATREEAKAAGTALGDVTPSITKKVAGSKLVKVAGVGGALISLADVASAKEAAQALGEMMLPIGATPSELQSGTLTAKQLNAFKEAQKLGSPYRAVPPPSMR
jgi:hypothetical protein